MALDDIFPAVPVDNSDVLALRHVRSILAQSDRNHVVLTSSFLLLSSRSRSVRCSAEPRTRTRTRNLRIQKQNGCLLKRIRVASDRDDAARGDDIELAAARFGQQLVAVGAGIEPDLRNLLLLELGQQA